MAEGDRRNHHTKIYRGTSQRNYDINDAEPGSAMHPSLLETNCDEERVMIENAIKEKGITPSQRYYTKPFWEAIPDISLSTWQLALRRRSATKLAQATPLLLIVAWLFTSHFRPRNKYNIVLPKTLCMATCWACKAALILNQTWFYLTSFSQLMRHQNRIGWCTLPWLQLSCMSSCDMKLLCAGLLSTSFHFKGRKARGVTRISMWLITGAWLERPIDSW